MSGTSERIVVTGGAGFVGSRLVARLLAQGAQQVTVVDDFSRGRHTYLSEWLGDPRLQVTQGDVRDEQLVRRALTGADTVYHLAARESRSTHPTDTDEVFTTNVVGTYNVLRVASESLTRRVVFASSYEVYGAPLSMPVDEDHPLQAGDLNGASKVAAEAYCRAYRRVFGLQTVVLRLAEVFGPGDDWGLVGSWVDRAARGEDLPVLEKDRIVDLVWVDQVVDAFIAAANRDTSLPPINVASGTGTRVEDIARRIARLSGGQSRVRALPHSAPDQRRFIAEVGRMRSLLGVEPRLDPLDQLAAIVRSGPLSAHP